MFRLTKIFLFSMLALIVGACTTSEPTSDQADIPNPASVYCEEQGGTVEIRTDSEGNQFGICILEDGSECDEWAFYRGECPAKADMPNPASVYCKEQGGTVEIRTDSKGNQFGICIFEDGSECDEWAFYRGECPAKADMPNPASVYCEEQGGTIEIRTDTEGNQFGICIFEDGSECDEWAFYRGECPAKADMPNPASAYCEEQGGTIEIHTDTEGNQFGICTFEDGSECDEWAFFRGECQPGEQEIAPSPVSSFSYTNETYGFSINLSSQWAIEEYDNYLILHRPDYSVFIGYQWSNEEPKPFRTGMPQGDFIDGGTAVLFEQSIPKRILVWEGKNKVIDYGGRIKAGDLIFVFYLDGVQSEEVSYNDIDLTPEIIAEVDQILASLALVSGEIPTLDFTP